MDTMHDYIAELHIRPENGGSPIVEARKSILTENDADAQRQAEEWAGTVAAAPNRATYLLVRHDDRVVVDQELRRSTS